MSKKSKKIIHETILWDKLRSGNVEVLGDLYDLFIDNLFSYGIQFSNDKSYVKDCIHDLFLDLHRYKKTLSATNNVKHYLLRSLKNKILKKKRGKLIFLFDENFEHKSDQKNYVSSIEEDIIKKESSDAYLLKLSNAITFLTKKQKKGLFLRFTEEKEYVEIAKIMNVSVPTARTIIYRGIKELRRHLILYFLMVKYFF